MAIIPILTRKGFQRQRRPICWFLSSRNAIPSVPPSVLPSPNRIFPAARPLSSIFSSSLANAKKASSHARRLSSQQKERGLLQLLNDEERRQLQEQKSITAKSRQIAQKIGISTRDFDSSSSILHDFSTFSIVICGEFNAGKSTLINALVGTKLIETGSLPTTDCITIVSAAGSADDEERENDPEGTTHHPGVVYHYVTQSDLPLLQDLTLVDTPGTNAVLTDHTTRTTRLLPAADLILFCTSCDRPFPESERRLLESIAAYRKSIVVVINKMDILEQTGGNHGAAEKQRVIDFVTDHASALLGARPFVLAVSARNALAAKTLGATKTATNTSSSTAPTPSSPLSALWERSNFAALEEFLQQSLTTEHKLRAKLTTPLGIAEGLLEQSLDRLRDEEDALESDIATLKLLSSQFKAWRKELSTDMDRIRSALHERVAYEGQRGALLQKRHSVWDFYRVCLVDGKHALGKEWCKTLPATMQRFPPPSSSSPSDPTTTGAMTSGIRTDLLQQAQEAAESIATLGRAQGQAVIEFLGQRPSSKNQSLVGTVTAASRFEETRSNLYDHLTRAIEKHVEEDAVTGQEQEAFLANLRRTAAVSAGLNVGGLGSALLLTALEWVDFVPGALVGSVAVACSAAVVSVGRQRLATAYANQWDSRARDLDEDLNLIFTKELERVDRRVQDGVSPYTRFVEVEQERIDQLKEQAQDTVASAHRLRHRINQQR